MRSIIEICFLTESEVYKFRYSRVGEDMCIRVIAGYRVGAGRAGGELVRQYPGGAVYRGGRQQFVCADIAAQTRLTVSSLDLSRPDMPDRPSVVAVLRTVRPLEGSSYNSFVKRFFRSLNESDP